MDVIERLDREWATLRESPRMLRALRRWGREEPVLAFATLDDLRARVERRDDSATADRILAALVRRAAEDRDAARVVLQLLLPGCKTLVRRYLVAEREERAATVVAMVWERIRTYPYERRPRQIAANVLLDVRQRIHRAAVSARPWVPIEELPDESLHAPPETERLDAREAVRLLGASVRAGVLDREAAWLVAATRLGGLRIGEVAERLGTSEQTLRRRRLRAEARVRDAAPV